jgi:hypothetical protein
VFELEQKIGIANSDWLMSVREKLGIIGLLELLRPKSTIEFGYHRGGATKWLSKYSEKVITVDVNEFVGQAAIDYSNAQAWNCSTTQAIERIKNEKLSFDLAIVDADHSRKAVTSDVSGLLDHVDIILMHDSCNPECRRGMVDALSKQASHAYCLDFISSTIKHDGLWGGLGIAYQSQNAGLVQEFAGEVSPYPWLALQNSFRLLPKIKAAKMKCSACMKSFINQLRIVTGKCLGR